MKFEHLCAVILKLLPLLLFTFTLFTYPFSSSYMFIPEILATSRVGMVLDVGIMIMIYKERRKNPFPSYIHCIIAKRSFIPPILFPPPQTTRGRKRWQYKKCSSWTENSGEIGYFSVTCVGSNTCQFLPHSFIHKKSIVAMMTK
jgi:hypothetical protein